MTISGCDARLWFICSLGVCGEQFDISAPETPRDVRASARSRQVVLTWTSNRDDVVSYRVYRSTTPGGRDDEPGSVPAPSERPDEVSYVGRGRH